MKSPGSNFAMAAALSLTLMTGCQEGALTGTADNPDTHTAYSDTTNPGSPDSAVSGASDSDFRLNQMRVDGLNATLASCEHNHWIGIAMCQDTRDKCLDAGTPEGDCDAGEDDCMKGVDAAEAECEERAKDIAGCDYTESKDVDTDMDGLSDSKELFRTFTNPCDPNSCGPNTDGERDRDGDGIPDAQDENPNCPEGSSFCGFGVRPGTAVGGEEPFLTSGMSCQAEGDAEIF